MLSLKMKRFSIALSVLFAGSVLVTPARSLNNTVEHNMRTECKTCPWSLCTNKAVYDSDNLLSLQCWTRGTVIDGDSTWLRTGDDCYVTQYDLTTYDGEYTDDLPYCGRASEREFYTKTPARTRYNTECNITPWITSDNIHYHKYGTDLTVTCYSDDQYQIINDATWLKTTDNCYVAQIGLTEKADRDSLDPCGPITQLELNNTYISDQKTSDSNDSNSHRAALSATLHHPPPAAAASDLHKRFLVNVTVGEDYALCHSAPTSNSTVQRRYPWFKELWLQCLERNDDTSDINETYWSLTTDFCWVRSVDLWQSPEGDNWRFPRCSLFV